MPLAINDAGDVLFLTDNGDWQPAKIAENPQTKERLAFDGNEWTPLKKPVDESVGLKDILQSGARGVPIAGGLYERSASPETKARFEEFDTAHPFYSGAAKIGGGIAALAPIAMTGPGAGILGMTGATLGRQALNSAISGAGIGALDELARGGNPVTGAAVGGGLGVAGPLAGQAIGKATGAVKDFVAPVPKVARNAETVGPVTVPLSGPQVTGDVANQRFLESARMGVLGKDAQQAMEEFNAQQKAGVGQVNDAIRGMIGGAETTPLEAAGTVQTGLQRAATEAKDAYTAKYGEFTGKQGELPVEAFGGRQNGVGQSIKRELMQSQEPIVIDEITTPASGRMVKHLDEGVHELINDNGVLKIDLKGVEQVRKQLLSLASGAANQSDRRAARGIIGAFDDRLQNGVNSALFTGDASALGTLKEARSLFAQYMQTFKSKGSGDTAGQIVEKIIGKQGQPATENQIAGWLYGANKVGANSQAMHVASKIGDIFGRDSAEWQAVRQGLFTKLVGDGETQKIASRIAEFTDKSGQQLARSVFSTKEITLISQLGSLLQKMTPVKGATNPSGSGYQVAAMLKYTMNALASTLGVFHAGPLGVLAGPAFGQLRAGFTDRKNAQAVLQHLYSDAKLPPSGTTAPARAGAFLGKPILGYN